MDRLCIHFLKDVPVRYFEYISQNLGKQCKFENEKFEIYYTSFENGNPARSLSGINDGLAFCTQNSSLDCEPTALIDYDEVCNKTNAIFNFLLKYHSD